MNDRIVLSGMVFRGRHGVHDEERRADQPFGVDVELRLDLRPAGRTDDLERTVDYAVVHGLVGAIVEGPSRLLLEALAEAIGTSILAAFPAVAEVVVRVRKPEVRLGGPLDWAGVEIVRDRAGG